MSALVSRRGPCQTVDVGSRWATATLLLVPALLASACAPRGHVRDEQERGRDSYVRACASCHGMDGRGDGPVAGALRVRPPDLTMLGGRYGGVFPREYVIAIITGERKVGGHGTREMPVWSERFGTGSGAAAAASFHARRRLEMLADHLASLQRTP